GGVGQDTFNNNTTIGTFRVDGYTATTYLTSVQVFTSTLAIAGAAIVIQAYGGSGLSGAGVIGSQPISGDTGTLQLNCFQTQNVNNVSDKITVAIAAPASSRGEFQDRLAEVFGYALNSAASGGQTIDERYVTCGTFPAYSVRDA